MTTRTQTIAGVSATTHKALRLLVLHPDWEMVTLHTRRHGERGCEDGPVWSAFVQDPHDIFRALTVPIPTFRRMWREHLLTLMESHVTSASGGAETKEMISTSYRPSAAGQIVGSQPSQEASA